MGLISDILKRTKTKVLATPFFTFDPTHIKSKSDKAHLKTVLDLEEKQQRKGPLTNKEKRAFRVAFRALESRGSGKKVTEVEG